MKKIKKTELWLGVGFTAAFILWTVLVRFVDLRAIGPLESEVGLGGLNGWFHGLTGVNMTLYTITDWAGLVPFAVAACFAVLGLVQWIKRKNVFKVDRSILVLGLFYIAVIGAYLLFEVLVINYRPTLIEGRLEASYPSSTTLLTVCVMTTAAIQLCERIKNRIWAIGTVSLTIAFAALTVIGRVLSGVHWITDIIGGGLLSAGLILLYTAFAYPSNK